MKNLKSFNDFVNESVQHLSLINSDDLVDTLETYYDNNKQTTLILGKAGIRKLIPINKFAELNNLEVINIHANEFNTNNLTDCEDCVIVIEDIDKVDKLKSTQIFNFVFNKKESFVVLTAVNDDNLESVFVNKLAIVELKWKI